VAVDGHGNVAFADTASNRVRVVAASTGTFFGRAMTGGDIYVLAGDGVAGYSGDGGPGDLAEVNSPQGVTVDGTGNVVFADTSNSVVRVVAASTGRFYGQAMTAGHVYTVAGNGMLGFSGDGGPATSAELTFPFGVGVDGSGNLLIADTLNNRVRVAAASMGTFYGQAMKPGDIYTVAGNGNVLFSGDGGPALSAGMGPQAVTVDGAGNLVIADRGNGRIRVVATTNGTFYGQAMTAGDIYTVAGGGNSFPGNGVPATSANLNGPWGTAVDSAGNLVFADTGSTGSQVRVVAVTNGTFYGQAMTAGDLYSVAGTLTTGFAGDGGPATSAELSFSAAVALTGQGDIVIADSGNNRIRLISG
jgi:sugar lactone lactonase YvrE